MEMKTDFLIKMLVLDLIQYLNIKTKFVLHFYLKWY